jgi:hypothetical protein
MRSITLAQQNSSEPHLDPDDWREFGEISLDALDDMIESLQSIRDHKTTVSPSSAPVMSDNGLHTLRRHNLSELVKMDLLAQASPTIAKAGCGCS